MASLLKKPIKLALVQLATGADKAANLSRARSRVLEAAQKGASLIVLPECFNSPYGCQYFPKYAETLLPSPPSKEKSPSFHALSDLAKEAKIYLLGGSIPEFETSSKKYFNTSLMFDPNGELIATHRKVHLFDIDIPGKITFKESEILSPGNKVTLVDLPGHGKIAIAICYDIRFPELAMIAARKQCFLLLYPGAFNLTTGALHWALQARARAMDNQLYVGLCSPARDMEASYNAWGHSMVVDPNAAVMTEAGEQEEIVYADLDGDKIEETRKGIPLRGQRRFDVYPDVSDGKRQPTQASAVNPQPEPVRASGDIRSRLRTLFSPQSEKRPPSAPCPSPAGVHTAANSNGDTDVGLSTGRAEPEVAHAKLTSFRRADRELFSNSFDGTAGQSPDSIASGPRRRSVQRGVVDGLGSEGDGQSMSTTDRTPKGDDFRRSHRSVREAPKKSEIDGPRRVRSTLTKTSTRPRQSLYNLKATLSADPQPLDLHPRRSAEEAKLHINHVPGSFRSEYDASIHDSQSSSLSSANLATPVTMPPLQRRSFEAVSSRGSDASIVPSASMDVGSAADATNKVKKSTSADKDSRPDAGVPFLRPMLSSYTLRENPSTAASQAHSASRPATVQRIIDSGANPDDLKNQPSDPELFRAIVATSNQALTPDLDARSAVPAVDFQTSEPLTNSSPSGKPSAALSEVNLRPNNEQSLGPSTSTSNNRDFAASRALRELPPSRASSQTFHGPKSTMTDLQQPTQSETERNSNWMRQLLGQKSAPAIGQAPPNLTARPRHRSPKVTEDVNLQRAKTEPTQTGPLLANFDPTRGPESFTRVITDLEGLLQQALQIAGQTNAKGNDDVASPRPFSPVQTFRTAPEIARARETSYESSSGSDDETSSDSSGLDEEQNRTTGPVKYNIRQEGHVSLVEPDEADRYHSQFKSQRHATPYPAALMKSSGNPSDVVGAQHEQHDDGEVRSKSLAVSGSQTVNNAYANSASTHQPFQITIQGEPKDVQNVLLQPVGVTSSSVDATDWAVRGQRTANSRRHPEPALPREPVQTSPVQPAAEDSQGFVLRARRPSRTTPTEIANASIHSDPRSFSSGDDKEPIAYFGDRPAGDLHKRGVSRRKKADEANTLYVGAAAKEDTLSPLPSDIGGRGPGSDPKSLDLKHRHHFSIREPKMFNLSHSHKRSPIARDWSISKKRWVALVACINTALMGLIVGIYAGEVPAIQYSIVDEHHYTILGNVVLFIGLAVTTSIFWPLPLLYGRKPFTLAALALLVPLQFPQAVVVSGFRTPYTPTYRVGLLLSRAVAGLVMGFANINFIATLLDLFGASLQSVNPHQEIVNENDVRRHGGGMGVWLGVWTWCFIGSIGVGFFLGAVIISGLAVDWGFWITIIVTAFVLVLNVLVPEVRRSPYRRSVAEVRTATEMSRRVARGEVKMHLYSTGPKWWIEEVLAGSVLCIRMLKQPGFLVLSTYVGWIYGQIVMIILLLGALTSKYYRFRPQYVGLCVLAIPLGALLAVPFQRASILSRSRQKPPRTDSMTVHKRLTWTSHFVRRAIFMVSLPFAGLAYTLASVGPRVSVAAPTFFAGLIGFLSNLAIAECHGIIMETYDTSDLQPGMTGRPRRNLPDEIRKRRTNFSSFPRVTAAFAVSQTMAFLIAAAATGAGGVIERRLGAQTATAVVAGILLVLTLLLIAVVTRFKQVQIIPSQRYGTNVLSGPEDEWKPVIIGNPSGTTRRMSVLELGNMTRWKEIRRRNRLTGLDGY
ncbi:MAG: hypothetical protein L6R35_000842 [Caloplaca aegaea]|nr:MAG: hypothetical protein L6R35_000842 [Caloplaca aegaea]